MSKRPRGPNRDGDRWARDILRMAKVEEHATLPIIGRMSLEDTVAYLESMVRITPRELKEATSEDHA